MSEATMTRRSIGLLVTLALALFVALLMADAQQPTKVYRVGRLSAGSPPEVSPFVQRTAEAFRQGLRELGHVEGQNLVLTWRFAEGRLERLPALATELVRLPVDVLVVSGGEPVIRAAQQATQTIPIVFAGASDPVGRGLIASLAQPGGNITGLTTFSVELLGKRLELLKELVPTVTRIAILANPANPATVYAVREAQAFAHALGVQPHVIEVRSPDEFERAFAAMTRANVGALLVLTDPSMFEPHMSAIVAPRTMWTRSSRAPSPPTCRWSSRPHSSWSSTSRPPRPSASPSLHPSSSRRPRCSNEAWECLMFDRFAE
jgi:putative ABC transport system substrate-binding protein